MPTSTLIAPHGFELLDEFRERHTELLKQYHASGCTDELAGLLGDFITSGRNLGKLLDRTEERIEAQRILDQWATILLKATGKDVETAIADFEGEDLSGKPCPYVGLKPFGESEHGYFFGRGRLIGAAVDTLERERFLAILGPSGSGKSSLVLGGILPALRSRSSPACASWIYLPPMVPGGKPLESMLEAFRAGAVPLPKEVDAAAIAAEPETLVKTVRTAAPGQSLCIVVDQFEEIFTLCEEPAVRESFTRSLLAFVDDPQAEHRLILTMRSDFEPRLASLPGLQDRFVENRTVLRATPLTRDELREAIEAPAKAVGLRFHKEVVDALLKDVGGEISALPLLQFTLLKLWDTKTRDRITLTQYNSLSGAKGALAQSANEFYDQLIEEEKSIAKRAFLRMVRLGEGLEVTSARIRISSLYELGYPKTRVDGVVEKLVRSGLVRATKGSKPEDDQLEVAHEALVRNWERFIGWLEKERASLLIRRRLDDKTVEWVRLGQNKAGLLDEVQLDEAQKWLRTTDATALGFHSTLPLLVERSQEALNAAKREKERAEEKLLEQMRLAEEEQRQRLDAERQLANEKRLREESRRADAERERALAQAKVGRRMRRIARLACIQNAAFVLTIVLLIIYGEGERGRDIATILWLVSLGLGLVILVMALRAIMSSEQPEPSSKSFLRRWGGNLLVGAQRIFGSSDKPMIKQ